MAGATDTALTPNVRIGAYRNVASTARARETDHVLHGRVVLHNVHQLRQLALHRLEGNALIGLHPADQQASVLLWE